MKTNVKGSLTIEAAVIVPMILLIFGILMHILFYWHDKVILVSAAYETVALGAGRSEMDEAQLEHEFYARVKGKLLLLNKVECKVQTETEEVLIKCSGSRKTSQVQVKQRMIRTKPERYIRQVRKIEKLGEGIGKEN